MSSTMIHGVGRDAERIAEAVEQRLMARARRRQPTPVAAA
jgi:hypothetical protein